MSIASVDLNRVTHSKIIAVVLIIFFSIMPQYWFIFDQYNATIYAHNNVIERLLISGAIGFSMFSLGCGFLFLYAFPHFGLSEEKFYVSVVCTSIAEIFAFFLPTLYRIVFGANIESQPIVVATGFLLMIFILLGFLYSASRSSEDYSATLDQEIEIYKKFPHQFEAKIIELEISKVRHEILIKNKKKKKP